jgi:hypothetical protein
MLVNETIVVYIENHAKIKLNKNCTLAVEGDDTYSCHWAL